VRGVSAADMEKAKAGLPYGIPVPGRTGMVTSPYVPEEGKYVDVSGFASGSIVKDPYTGKFSLVCSVNFGNNQQQGVNAAADRANLSADSRAKLQILR